MGLSGLSWAAKDGKQITVPRKSENELENEFLICTNVLFISKIINIFLFSFFTQAQDFASFSPLGLVCSEAFTSWFHHLSLPASWSLSLQIIIYIVVSLVRVDPMSALVLAHKHTLYFSQSVVWPCHDRYWLIRQQTVLSPIISPNPKVYSIKHNQEKWLSGFTASIWVSC